MEGQHLEKISHYDRVAMMEATKGKRVKAANVLLKTYGSREKIKTLIGYPKLQSIRVVSSGTNVSTRAVLIDDIHQIDISNQLGENVATQTAKIDTSKDSARLQIQVDQNLSAWNLNAPTLEVRHEDGSFESASIGAALSGDGTESAQVLQIEKKMPTPRGWPNF
mgnify:CR=1 FL=1